MLFFDRLVAEGGESREGFGARMGGLGEWRRVRSFIPTEHRYAQTRVASVCRHVCMG